MKLTNKQLDQIKAAETANILKKLKAGKTLSANERAQIESLREKQISKSTPKQGFSGTVGRWARELNKDDQTIAKALGSDYKAGREYSAREIWDALYGEEKAEKVALMKQDRIAKERENRVADGQLVNAEECKEAFINEFIVPFKAKLFALARREGFERHILALIKEFQV
jgi:hypothetical protein